MEDPGLNAGSSAPVAGSIVTASKSATPSKIFSDLNQAFSALRLASTSALPWVGVLPNAVVSVAT